MLQALNFLLVWKTES